MDDSGYQRGEMDIREHRSTYSLFMGLAKWGSLLNAVGILFFVLWLCAEAGFFAALAAAVALLLIGGWYLTRKPSH